MAMTFADPSIACHNCGKQGSIIKGREEFGGGWVCWKNAKNPGCGQKFTDAEMIDSAAMLGVPVEAVAPEKKEGKKDHDLGDYVEVVDRLQMFLADHPDGRVQPANAPEYKQVGDSMVVIYSIAVYRNADDPKPSIAYASEPFPGKTPYTKDSELMNAETSALGRALGLMGYGIGKSIASKNEVLNRVNDKEHVSEVQSSKPVAAPVVTKEEVLTGMHDLVVSAPPVSKATVPYQPQDAVCPGCGKDKTIRKGGAKGWFCAKKDRDGNFTGGCGMGFESPMSRTVWDAQSKPAAETPEVYDSYEVLNEDFTAAEKKELKKLVDVITPSWSKMKAVAVVQGCNSGEIDYTEAVKQLLELGKNKNREAVA